MKYFLISILSLIISCINTYAIDPLLPPSSNFDLSDWKLQTLDDNLNVVNILSPELINGYSTQFFYTDKTDGSMVFKVPSNGDAITGATGYSRVELRQMSGGANWPLTDPTEHYLSAQCKVISMATVKPQMIISQIHGSENESEMIKLRWYGYKPGQCYVDARFELNDATKTEYGATLATGLSLGDLINYTITMKNGTITVTVNGNSASQTYTPEFFGTSDAYYFKAGNYFSYNNVALNDPNIYIGQSQFYKISLIKQMTSEILIPEIQNFKVAFNSVSKQLTVESEQLNQFDFNLGIYSLNGKSIKNLVLEKNKSNNKICRNIYIIDLKSGVYIVKLSTRNYSKTAKLLIN